MNAHGDELLPLVYDQLRRIAQQRMLEERPGHTLQPTALVHEAYARLAADGERRWEGRAHFFAAAAEAMRRILVEHARARGAVKRGGGARRMPLSVVDLSLDGNPEEIMAVDEAISRLEREQGRLGQLVRLRFYAGLSHAETAEVLGISERTARRDWELARALLVRELGPDAEPGQALDGDR